MIFLECADKTQPDTDVQNESNISKRSVGFYVVDAHTHIGKEEVLEYGRKAYRTNSPKTTLDFYQRLQFEIIGATRINSDKFYLFPAESFTKPPVFLGLLVENTPDIRSLGWTIDKFVSFPFNDATAYKTSPSFQIPNDRILSRAAVLPYSLRMLGFVRVDPHEGEKAVEELVRCSQLGARGLKLHPISQKFLDDVVSDNVKKVVIAAARLGLPVLFDCRYYSTAEDIYRLTQEVREELGSSDFAVIIGHSGMEYTRDELYEFFKDPSVYAETSGLRGYDVPLFFKRMKNIVPNWSSKIIFGTDYNYFSIPQATDFLTYLFTKEFHEELEGGPEDIQRILAGNILSIIKPFRVLYPGENKPVADGIVYNVNIEYADIFLKNLSEKVSSLIKSKKLAYVTYDILLSSEFEVDFESLAICLSREKLTTPHIDEIILIAKRKAGGEGEYLSICNATAKLLQIEEDISEGEQQETILNAKLYTKLLHEILFSSEPKEIKTREEAEKLPKSLIK
ncbi:MAG: amidohydrolase family protein [Candidatus Jordarchaeum sp.]|uniref:amidohydrolase family protein n=1 Tax=Candidatus Jordarchaeum sp. TaxID=2823881 RepID=UPI00404AA3BE